ncbi:lysoplasmalogenase [Paenibacillus sp. GCM10027627]|uniref:lysoplasmalogenase n=1 Tax=unclassified Paenibacillus TaxID=185978 RepID=UPI0036413004
MNRKIGIGLIIATGLIHLATLSVDSEPLHWVFKLLPMVLIITLAVQSAPAESKRPGAYKGLIVTGLLFSIAGDAFLLLPDEQWFTFGLGAFLIGHLFYIAAMATRLRGTMAGWISVLPIGVYSFVLGSKFYDSLHAEGGESGLWIPVLVYILAIAIMCWTAVLSGNRYAAIGAILFVASDSILAWNKFVSDVPASGILIMSTYFAAQLFIAGSISEKFFPTAKSSGRGFGVGQ